MSRIFLLCLLAGVAFGQNEKGTLIYLHGFGDGGRMGVVRNSCRTGEVRNAAEQASLRLECPTTADPVYWVDETARIEQLAKQSPQPVYLAGHSFGGRAALQIGLDRNPGLFRAVVAVAPAIASLGLYRTLPDVLKLVDFTMEPFDVSKAVEVLNKTKKPVLIVTGLLDGVVSFVPGDHQALAKTKAKVLQMKTSTHLTLVKDSVPAIFDFIAKNP